jgi:hypothetical protein
MRKSLTIFMIACGVLSRGVAETSIPADSDGLRARCLKAMAEICAEIRKIQPQYSELSAFQCTNPPTLSLSYRHKVEHVTSTASKGKRNDHDEAREGGCLLQIQFLGGLWQVSGGIQKMYTKTNVLVQAVIHTPNAELADRLEKIVRSKIPRIDEQ